MVEIPGRIQVLIAPNAFKGTLTAVQAARAIQDGVLAARPSAFCRQLPLADGGDGFLETVLGARAGELVQLQVAGPLRDPVLASYGWLPDAANTTALIELAKTSGLKLVAHPSPDTAARATTRGLGELLRKALARRPATILVGLGGAPPPTAVQGWLQPWGLGCWTGRASPSAPAGSA